jgi:hypothetical protein
MGCMNEYWPDEVGNMRVPCLLTLVDNAIFQNTTYR